MEHDLFRMLGPRKSSFREQYYCEVANRIVTLCNAINEDPVIRWLRLATMPNRGLGRRKFSGWNQGLRFDNLQHMLCFSFVGITIPC